MPALHTSQAFGGRKVLPGQLSTSQKCLTSRGITSNSGPRGTALSSLWTTADGFAAAGCRLGDVLVGRFGVEANVGLVFDDMIISSHHADL